MRISYWEFRRVLFRSAVSAITALTLRVAILEDIDLFSVDDGSQVDAPNVLIVLDNSANWSRQSQQWPGGLTQGQSEVRAIKTEIGRASGGERECRSG